MRFPIACTDCVTEKGTVTREDFAHVAYNDDGRYELTCSKGHNTVIILQQQKFELLFEIGAYAITDGYFREGVSSFTSSLERFYEFFIKAALFQKGIGLDVIEPSWKIVAKQSERQLGAFVFLYTQEFGKPPEVLPEKYVQIRNDVIHRGKIPSLEQVLEYGQVVMDLIRPILREAKERYPKGVQQTILDHIRQSHRDNKERSSGITIPTIVSLNIEDEAWNNRPLVKAISELRKSEK
jgi:hypothetical protein